ncbi:MAG: hypothetical protein IPI23_09195 [Bacteroidetes bacterium]|nr:hypothetical protein [Bacteroidota bacterium]
MAHIHNYFSIEINNGCWKLVFSQSDVMPHCKTTTQTTKMITKNRLMTINRITFFGILFCIMTFNLSAQPTEKADTTKSLIGQWVFVKTLDANNNEVKYVTQDYKGPTGSDSQIVANGPDITINADHTYVKKFTDVDSDKGNWRLISNNEVEYEMVIEKDSRQGNMIKQTQELLGNKWRTDSNGNYLDASNDKIVLLTENEMRVEYHKKYVLVYRKK